MARQHTSGRLILVRHGESEGNRDKVFTLTTDVPLTDKGQAQARAAAQQIAQRFRPTRIVASSYARAQQTARIIAEHIAHPDGAVDTEHTFHERLYGDFAGRAYADVLQEATFNNAARWEWAPTGGESLQDVQQRVTPAFHRLAQAHPEEDVVLVSHGGVMFALSAYINGAWEEAVSTPNCGIIVVEYHEDTYRITDKIFDHSRG